MFSQVRLASPSASCSLVSTISHQCEINVCSLSPITEKTSSHNLQADRKYFITMLKHYSDRSETKAMDSRSWTGNNTFEHTSNKTRSTVITKHCKRHFLKAAAKPLEICGDYPHLSPREWRLGLTARSDKLPCNHKACHSHIPQKARKVSLLLILKPFWRLLLSVISVPSVGLHHVCFPCGREMADDHREARDHSRNSRKRLCTKTVRVSQKNSRNSTCVSRKQNTNKIFYRHEFCTKV